MISFRRKLAILSAGLLLNGCSEVSSHPKSNEEAEATSHSKPNIVFFLIDDLGWKDISCMGSEFHETPNIDRLAEKGITFTNGYSAHPRCVPSRYSIHTGRFPGRDGVPGLPTHEAIKDKFTIGEALQAGGYKTCFLGKWHTGDIKGFDKNVGGGHAGSLSEKFWPYEGAKGAEIPGLEQPYRKNTKPYNKETGEGEYITDRLTWEAVDFIRENKNKPFFVYLSHFAVHTPIQAKKEKIARYRKKLKTMSYSGPEMMTTRGGSTTKLRQDSPEYAAMIESVDESIGRVMFVLDSLGLKENTLVVFSGDNGGLSSRGATSTRSLYTTNYPLLNGKGWCTEGGVREPFIVNWPGRIASGTSEEIVTLTDLYPTFLDVAGLPLRSKDHVDAVSFAPLFDGGHMPEDRALFFHSPLGRPNQTGDFNCSAVRVGDYKLIDWYDDKETQLFNLKQDIGEQADSAAYLPEKKKELLDRLNQWREEVGVYYKTKKKSKKK